MSVSLFYGPTYSETSQIGLAVSFPDLTFEQTLSREEKAYLEIPRKNTFSLKEIRGSLILVEFLSIYCVNCQRQAPIFNDLYSSIEKNPRLKGKVKMIGIAAGNSLPEGLKGHIFIFHFPLKQYYISQKPSLHSAP